ncbi:MAG: hypothetical protein N2645_14575 [Clostridia bacterium]|nr:hypothetical protein [Clostridia bacterium]
MIGRHNPVKWNIKFKIRILLGGMSLNVLLHAILDILPHSYPLSGKIDVILSLVIYAMLIILMNRQYIPVFLSCFLGRTLPDVIDLGSGIFNKIFDTGLPTVKIFPWHWPQYSGSIFDGSNFYISFINHQIVIISFVLTVYIKRELILKAIFRKQYDEVKK